MLTRLYNGNHFSSVMYCIYVCVFVCVHDKIIYDGV